jgi:KDO2-lipid IV(A) lauroyltransferase
MMTTIRYFLEAVGIQFLFAVFKMLPLDIASNVGGFLGKIIGPHLKSNQTAIENLRRCLPKKDKWEYDMILKGMWENLGRSAAELPHLREIAHERVEFEGLDVFKQLATDNLPAIFISGHFANWEAGSAAIVLNKGMPLSVVFRQPNNPWVAMMMEDVRGLDGQQQMIQKSRTGTKQMMAAMQEGRHVGMLIDQKYNEGIAVPFMGHPAMTSPAFANLCQRFECPLVPIELERTYGANFKLTFHPPMKLFDDNGKPLPIKTVIEDAHHYLENWITERPAQWLWLHRRWNSKALEKEEFDPSQA